MRPQNWSKNNIGKNLQLGNYSATYQQYHSFIHSFHWHVLNVTIPWRSQELLPFLSVIYPPLPPFFHQLVCHPPSLHLAIYFLVYLSALLLPNSYIILFWEFYFLPFSVHAQTNVIYLTLLSLLPTIPSTKKKSQFWLAGSKFIQSYINAFHTFIMHHSQIILTPTNKILWPGYSLGLFLKV